MEKINSQRRNSTKTISEVLFPELLKEAECKSCFNTGINHEVNYGDTETMPCETCQRGTQLERLTTEQVNKLEDEYFSHFPG